MRALCRTLSESGTTNCELSMPLPKSILCSACNKTYPEGWRRCPYCGHDELQIKQEASGRKFMQKKVQEFEQKFARTRRPPRPESRGQEKRRPPQQQQQQQQSPQGERPGRGRRRRRRGARPHAQIPATPPPPPTRPPPPSGQPPKEGGGGGKRRRFRRRRRGGGGPPKA